MTSIDRLHQCVCENQRSLRRVWFVHVISCVSGPWLGGMEGETFVTWVGPYHVQKINQSVLLSVDFRIVTKSVHVQRHAIFSSPIMYSPFARAICYLRSIEQVM